MAVPVAAQTVGSCSPGDASAQLSDSDVRATVYNTGGLFYKPDVASAQYVVPKSTQLTALYAVNLWVGGTVGGQERVAGATFGETEFWPGPLLDGAALPDPTDCSAYDRIYTLHRRDLEQYEQSGTATDDLAEWPVGLGAPAVDAGGQPIRPTSRDQVINLAGGERPVLFGTEMAFWVTNDVGNAHQSTGSEPLGVEVQTVAFTVDSSDLRIEQATFYRFRVVNRNSQPIEDLRLTWWQDTDLGFASDDFQGTDPSRSLAFTYNDPEDGAYGTPPATGVDFLSGNLAASMALQNGSADRGDPHGDPIQYRNIQRARWRDGTPLTRLDRGYNPTPPDSEDGTSAPTPPEETTFAFEGDPTAGEFWSEFNADGEGSRLPGGNKRLASSTGSVTLRPGQAVDLDVALLFAQGSSNLDSVDRLFTISDLVQSRYDGDALFPAAPFTTDAEQDADGLRAQVRVAPNPARGDVRIRVEVDQPGAVRLDVVDALGRRVARLADGVWSAGGRDVAVSGLAPGVYLAVLDADGRRQSVRFTVVR